MACGPVGESLRAGQEGVRLAAPPRRLRVLLAQLDFVVGDVAGNAQRIGDTLDEARRMRVDVAVFPELAVCGYPPDDLLTRPSFVAAAQLAVADLARRSYGLTAVVGTVDRRGDLYNSAAVMHDGVLVDIVHKAFLPNYGVFDEQRYFRPGRRFPIYDRQGIAFGVSICEDIWQPTGPAHYQAQAGAEIVINISSSPYVRGKGGARERMLATRAIDDRTFVVFCNLVGGQDELVFDGNSLVIGPTGDVIDRGASFAEDTFVVDLFAEEAFRERLLDPRSRRTFDVGCAEHEVPRVPLRPILKGEPPALPERVAAAPLSGLAEVHAALVLGVRDYASKNGFERAVIALSGGIDSALTASIAVDALGPRNVVGVAMPTRHSAPISLEDAQALSHNLGCDLVIEPIDEVYQCYLDALAPAFGGDVSGLAAENLQPRIRGNVLMAFSNKMGYLVLTTGNKSETSVGYVTMYGDTAGGFAPLKDVPKTLVYELARWRNEAAGSARIPERSIRRAPTAELKPQQTDQDVLPPYDVLDSILTAYVECEKSVSEIVAMGFDRATVESVVAMVDRAEYKRRQSPPGIKISERAFGRDRRMPITKRVVLPATRAGSDDG
jgi:NAD+ synthase (glutamine-hydrolysing)